MKLFWNRIVTMVTMAVFPMLCLASLHAQDNEPAKSELLVSADWLAKEMQSNANLCIIDLAFRKTNYDIGHIPGAVFLDWRSDIIDSKNSHLYRLPPKQAMEMLMSRIGVNKDTTIVLTDDMSSRAAVRMYYTLKYFGHQDVRILNGGTGIWKSSNRELTKELPKIKPTKYSIAETNDDYFVRMEVVKQAIDDDEVQVIDGRPADQYTGKIPGKAFHNNTPHKRLGHVPQSVNIPWGENLNPDGTFKSLPELRELYKSNGIDIDGEVITYCNEGLHAAMPWFILRELFGNEEIRLYDDSMAEWANRTDTPLKKTYNQSGKK